MTSASKTTKAKRSSDVGLNQPQGAVKVKRTHNTPLVSKNSARSITASIGLLNTAKGTYDAFNDIITRMVQKVVTDTVLSNGAKKRTITAQDIAESVNNSCKVHVVPVSGATVTKKRTAKSKAASPSPAQTE